MQGHTRKDFLEYYANERNIPDGCKSRNNGEHALITTNVNKKYATEYMCMTVVMIENLKFTDGLKLLEDKNAMIPNNGATCDSISHADGIKMIRNRKVGDSITNTSGKDMAAKYVGNMHGSKCSNKGKVVN